MKGRKEAGDASSALLCIPHHPTEGVEGTVGAEATPQSSGVRSSTCAEFDRPPFFLRMWYVRHLSQGYTPGQSPTRGRAMKPHYRLPCHGGRWSVIAGLRRRSWLSAPVDVEAELQLGLELGPQLGHMDGLLDGPNPGTMDPSSGPS